MYLKGWQANATGEDVESVLSENRAIDIKKHEGQEAAEFTWTSYVDTDDDILDVLSIALWYNDRTEDSIREVRAELKSLLARHRRTGH